MALVGAAAREDRGAAAGAEQERLLERAPAGEPEREPGGKAVAAAVRVLHWTGRRHGAERPTGPHPAAERTRAGDHDPRRRLELTPVAALHPVRAAADEHCA